MYQFATAKETSTAKTAAFVFSFQLEEPILKVNKSEITGEHAFKGDLLQIEDKYQSSKDEKHDLSNFFRFAARVLTVTLRNTFIQVFRALFGFCTFQGTRCGCGKLRMSSLNSTLRFE